MKQPLIILAGPTAVGKTEASIGLAKAVGGEIISADSMQVYRHMDIGSAKINPEEMQGVPHYLIDELEPSEDFNVYRFQELKEKSRFLWVEQVSIFSLCYMTSILHPRTPIPHIGKN